MPDVQWYGGRLAPLSSDGTNVTLDSGQLILPNGTAAAPSVRFSSDAATGIGLYRVGANIWGFATNGGTPDWIVGAAGPGGFGQVLAANAQYQFSNTNNAATGTADVGLARDAIGRIRVSNANTGLGDLTFSNIIAASGYLEVMEQALPAAGQRSSCRLFVVDNGVGKRSLRCIFGTGAAQIIATEP